MVCIHYELCGKCLLCTDCIIYGYLLYIYIWLMRLVWVSLRGRKEEQSISLTQFVICLSVSFMHTYQSICFPKTIYIYIYIYIYIPLIKTTCHAYLEYTVAASIADIWKLLFRNFILRGQVCVRQQWQERSAVVWGLSGCNSLSKFVNV
jgi:hypothetical protein